MDITTLANSLQRVTVTTNSELVLTETGGAARLTEVTVSKLPPGAFMMKLDEIKVTQLFQRHLEKPWGFLKHGDYMIVTDSVVVVVEMKSKSDPRTNGNLHGNIIKKFNSDLSILKYCDSVFVHLRNLQPFFEERNIYYIALCEALPISKTSTSAAVATHKSPVHTKPGNYAVIQVPNKSKIDFSRFLAGV